MTREVQDKTVEIVFAMGKSAGICDCDARQKQWILNVAEPIQDTWQPVQSAIPAAQGTKTRDIDVSLQTFYALLTPSLSPPA